MAARRRGWRRGCSCFFYQDRPAWKSEIPRDVVDDVDLARVEAGLERLQRKIDLEDHGFAVWRGDLARDYGLRFVNLCTLL